MPVNNVSSDICRQDAFCALYTDGISCRKQFRYLSQQNTPLGRTFPFLTKWFPPLSRGWHCPRGVLPARSAFPPIHFGREEGVERTLLRVACQSETFLASPWQGDANIRFVGHIGCQSDFDELVSMACRPVDRGFCRMGSVLTSFHPVKGPFARTKTANHKSSSASEPPHRARRSAF